MGQIIRLPFRVPAYPDAATDLNKAERLLLTAVRWWVKDRRSGQDALTRLKDRMGRAEAKDAALSDAALSIDSLMTIVSRCMRRPIDMHCPACGKVSEDEKQLLAAAALAQAGQAQMATRVLRTTLLSAQGTEFALGPLEGLGALFARARLILRLPADFGEPADGGAASGSAASTYYTETIH
jgi:hypothetical protein